MNLTIHMVKCPACDNGLIVTGDDLSPDNPHDVVRCGLCNGEGKVLNSVAINWARVRAAQRAAMHACEGVCDEPF